MVEAIYQRNPHLNAKKDEEMKMGNVAWTTIEEAKKLYPEKPKKERRKQKRKPLEVYHQILRMEQKTRKECQK